MIFGDIHLVSREEKKILTGGPRAPVGPIAPAAPGSPLVKIEQTQSSSNMTGYLVVRNNGY